MTPLFTKFTPDPWGKILQTGFHRFESSVGIDGLARVNSYSEMIELLAVHAKKPGKGQFREFIKRLKREYRIICIWHIENRLLDKVLPRYGFAPEVMVDSRREILIGYRWDRPNLGAIAELKNNSEKPLTP